MRSRNGRLCAILGLLAVGAGAYWWWTRPERRIRAILADVAAALTYEPGESGVQSLAGIAAIEPHLAADVAVQAGDGPSIEGRDAVITAGARLRARTPAMRVRFSDPQIAFVDERTATVVATAEAVLTTAAGEQRRDVHQVMATVTRPADRWVVSRARASPIPEPSP